jgi:hypothetical protein
MLRAAGLSRGKLAAVRDLAAKCQAAVVHKLRKRHNLTDDELVARLTEVRGIAPWTVHMLNAVTERRSMKAKVGLWIDHREAIIVVLTEKGEETKRIESSVEKQLRRSGRSPSDESFEPQLVPADDTRERDYMGHLANYYDEVIACIGDAETILIFGPGEAKGELKKRMERDKIGIRIVTMETADKMTEPQIVAKVKQRLF